MAEDQNTDVVGERPWWDEQPADKNKTSNGLKVYTPDPTKYHNVNDEKVASHMGRGITNATMIPRSRADGTSRGFDANKPNIIRVDPDRPGGGFLLDPAKLRGRDSSIRSLIAGVGGAVGTQDEEVQDNMQHVYSQLAASGAAVTIKNGRALGKSAQPVQVEPQPRSPVPRAFGQAPVEPELDSQPRASAPAQVPQFSIAQQAENLIAAQPVSLEHGQLIAQMKQLMEVMAQATAVARPDRLEIPVEVETRDAGIDSLAATIDMPFLTVKPGNPRVKVIFDLGTMGVMSTMYHFVTENDGCLVLVYDTRFESGNIFIPPVTAQGVWLKLHLPRPDGKKGRTMSVASMGLQFAIGCLDCVVLLVAPPEPVHAVKEFNRMQQENNPAIFGTDVNEQIEDE